jgi:hypothetical protein
MKKAMLTFAVALVIPVAHTAGQGADPIIGTWELNVAKSTYRTGPTPRQETRTFEAVGDSVKYEARGTDAHGKPTIRQNVAKYDGKDYSATGHPTADTIAYKKIDSHTSQAVLKKAGKVIITNTRVVSKDGKMFTLTDNATDSEGKLVSNVLVFERR